MSTIIATPQNGNGVTTTSTPPTTINVSYTETPDAVQKYTVTVDPPQVDRFTQMPVQFVNPDGGKVRIVFLSPMGEETDEVQDSQPCYLKVGGYYHFNCYFTPKGSTQEVNFGVGGDLDVIPHKP